MIIQALTKFPTHQDVREALRADLEGLSPAVDFIDKHWGLDKLQIAIEQALIKYVRINWDLTIHWESALNFPYLVILIDSTIDRTQLQSRSSELEDIFRKLFNDSFQITMGRLLSAETGQIFLEVFAYTGDGIADQFIVSCGRRLSIENKDKRYERFLYKHISSGSTEKISTAQTVYFAATTYILSGGKLEEISPFKLFYRNKPIEVVCIALDHLFNTTLASWYTKGRYYGESIGLDEFYRDWLELNERVLNPLTLEHRVEVLCKEMLSTGLARLDYALHKLTYYFSDGSSISYPNPASYIISPTKIASEPLVLCGTTHGNVDTDTVLVDNEQRTWLINFSRLNQGPLLRDFVSLEITVKLDLLDSTDLQMRYALEKQLLALNRLDDTINAEGFPSELSKVLGTVEHIRQLATSQVGAAPESYLSGLFFCAVARIVAFDPNVRHTRRELVPFAHSLLMAAMLCEKLGSSSESSGQLSADVFNRLWIDELNKKVWSLGQSIDVTPQEFEILKYLYERAGQLCSREAIIKEALGEEYGHVATETSRLNSAMSRLRQKIELDPENPRFIVTERGYGYKLMV